MPNQKTNLTRLKQYCVLNIKSYNFPRSTRVYHVHVIGVVYCIDFEKEKHRMKP